MTTKCYAVLFYILHVYVLAPVVFMLLPNKKKEDLLQSIQRAQGCYEGYWTSRCIIGKMGHERLREQHKKPIS